jgi:hypothetical protein
LKVSRLLLAIHILTIIMAGCAREEKVSEQDTFSFVVYPGSRYLGQLTELTKQASKFVRPNEDVPPTAIYDSEASVEEIAKFYADSYGYSGVAPDASNNMSVVKPNAYYRRGDLAADAQAIQPLLQKMNVSSDNSKAIGTYQAAEIEPRPNRPRVTIQRPYFDVSSSQVVDRTMILMAR